MPMRVCRSLAALLVSRALAALGMCMLSPGHIRGGGKAGRRSRSAPAHCTSKKPACLSREWQCMLYIAIACRRQRGLGRERGVVVVADYAGRAAVAAEPLLVMEGRGVVLGGCSDGD